MTKIITKNSSVYAALGFKSSLDDNSFYMFLGKSTAWPTESVPPDLVDSNTEQTTTINNIFALKKVTSTNACLVVPRIDWSSGTTYAAFVSGDTTLFTKNFYVLTDELNVYKCLDNNGNAPSVVKPTSTSTGIIRTGDGYSWKFMYDLSGSIAANFLTTTYLPVPTGAQRTTTHITTSTTTSYSAGDVPSGHGSSAENELGASKVMIFQQFTGTESGIISATNAFRQFGIIVNPKLNSGVIASGTVYSVNDTNSIIDANSGHILITENRVASQRSTVQSENLKIVISF